MIVHNLTYFVIVLTNLPSKAFKVWAIKQKLRSERGGSTSLRFPQGSVFVAFAILLHFST